jgi:hypothetical protein
MRDLTRLAKLAEVLEEIPPENFNMRVLYNLDVIYLFDDDDLTLLGLLQTKVVTCTLGWAALYKPFAEEGLKLELKSNGLNKRRVVYETEEGIEETYTAEKFFNLRSYEANWVFNPNYYSPAEVYQASAAIERIESLIKNDGLTELNMESILKKFYLKVLHRCQEYDRLNKLKKSNHV